MALEVVKNIDVDFYNKEYILINAKQYDTNSRVISITCYNQGELMRLGESNHSAYVKYRKADGTGVFNSCRINSRGQVLVELTEQMLAVNGVCRVDLVIVNKGDALVSVETGDVIAIDDSSILSTMEFYVNVCESAVGNPEFESMYECDALNDLLQRAEADYSEVVTMAKSYAVGGTGIRGGENTDNAKYYYQQSRNNASTATDYGNLAKSYAVGGTGTRVGEDVDNAKYYASVVRDVINSINNSLIPVGSITFGDLASAEKAVGYMYNISDEFITDESFVEGAGIKYNAGVNVYLRSDGLWDCLGGAATTKIETATADEVKNYLGLLM